MKRLIAAAICVLLLLGACGVIKETGERGRPIPASKLDMTDIGYPGRVEKFAVYFYNTTSKTLTAEIRTIIISQDANPAEVAVGELLMGPSNDSMLSKVAPEGMELERIEYSRDVANVYISYDGEVMQPKDKYILELAIANTVTDILGTTYISVFYNGLQTGFYNGIQAGLSGVPYAPLKKHTGSIEDAWLQESAIYAEVPSFPYPGDPKNDHEPESGDEDSLPPAEKQNEMTTVLYYISAGGGFILPETRKVKYTDGKYIEGLITELGKRPLNSNTMTNPLADDLKLIEPPAVKLASGGYSLLLNFSKLPIRYDYSDTKDAQLSYAAMAYTITGFVPGIESIEIYVNGVKVAPAGENAADEVKKSNYLGFMGSSAPIYFADKSSDLLLEVSRSMEQGKTWSARARLLELIKGPISGDEENAWPVMPAGITQSDVLSVDVYSDTVYVNLSQKFREDCAGLSSKNEMLLVYAIVNTLTAMDGISKVQFLIEGQQTDTLAGNICLSGPFIRNFGIIKKRS